MECERAWWLYQAAEKRFQRAMDADNDPTGLRLAGYAVRSAFNRWLDAVGMPDDHLELLADAEPDDALPLEHAGADGALFDAAR